MDAIVFFDIRDFTSHREFLAFTHSGEFLTRLVKKILESAVKVGTELNLSYGTKETPLLNHTGDGFVLVFRGRRCGLMALLFASRMRNIVQQHFEKYTIALEKHIQMHGKPKTRLNALSFGIGIHCGGVTIFSYQGFKGTRRGFVGSAVNVASRIEGVTKTSAYQVVCSEQTVRDALTSFPKTALQRLMNFFVPLPVQQLKGLSKKYPIYGCLENFHVFVHKSSILSNR